MIALTSCLVTLAFTATPEGPIPHVSEDGSKSGRVHAQLDTDATWGVGAQMFLGTQIRAVAVLEHWTTRHAIGTWELGGAFAYQNEPTFLLIGVDSHGMHGAGHRIQLLAHVGHAVHLGRRRRIALGLHAFAGWNHWRSAYSLSYPAEAVSGSATVDRDRAIVGGELRLTYRFHRNIGVNVVAGGVAPTASSYLVTFGHVGLGLSWYLG